MTAAHPSEREVLGVLLVFEERIPYAAERLCAEDFEAPRHRPLYECILDLSARSVPVTVQTIREALGPRLHAVGGEEYLRELADLVTGDSQLTYHVGVVALAGHKRRALAELDRARAEVHDLRPGVDDVGRTLGEVRLRLDAVLASRGPGGAGGALAVQSYADIAPERLEWLWPGRIPAGKVTLLFGDPGLGKSLVTVALAAYVSRGDTFPDGERAPLGSAFMLSAEDDPGDTIRPRLDAARADVSKVHNISVPNGWFSLAENLVELERWIEEIGDVRLVVIDPVSAYMGGTDSHKNAEVRQILGPISEMAGRTGAAVVIVTHLNKGSGGKALYRVTGSGAFPAAARAGWIVVADPERPLERRMFLQAKTNLGPAVTGLAYSVVAGDGGPVIAWEPGPVEVTPGQVLASEADTGRDGGEGRALDGAMEFLQEVLASGAVHVQEIKDEAKEAGIAWRTVERAKSALGVRSQKEEFGGKWVWLPPRGTNTAPPIPGPWSQRPPTANRGGDRAAFDGGLGGDAPPERGAS